MQIDVIQAKDLEFKRFRFWSTWFDIAVLDLGNTPYLLQMRVSRCNGKRFRSIPIVSRFKTLYGSIESLTQMSKTK
jgi:hypothetical protein